MIGQLKTFLKNITYAGVTSEHSPAFGKRIILTNILGLLFTINMSLSALAFFYFKHFYLGLFTSSFVLTEISWPIFNYYRRYNISRVGMLVSSNFLGFMVSIYLPGTGYNNGFFVMAGLPILLFGLHEKSFIILGLILPLILYPISEWAQFQLPLNGYGLVLSPEMSSLIHYAIGVIYVALIFLMFLFLSRENARSEEKLEKAYIELEEQRTRTFSSAKFAALGEMASGIGHEINNPMTVIELNTDYLKDILNAEKLNRELALERADVISKTVKRVAKIINSMRSFSRQGKYDERRPESIKKIMDETLIFCAERFKNHQVDLSIELPKEDLMLNCRAVQISQVLLNLLNNAFDAVEPLKDKWIKLAIFKKDNQIIITVTDSGPRIPLEEEDRIFLPFYTTKPVGKGTGLGLSLSRQIIEDHEGSIRLDSRSAQTRFVIELPA